jgi:hypothetical protein
VGGKANPAMNIGQMNQEAVERILADLHIPILARDLGGGSGRHLTLDTASGSDVYVFTNTGIEDVRASITGPLVLTSAQTVPQLLPVTGNLVLERQSFTGSVQWDTQDGGTLLVWTPAVGIASVTDELNSSWPYRLVAASSTDWVFAVPLAGSGVNGVDAGTVLTITLASQSAGGYVVHVQGTPFLPKLPVQWVNPANPAAGANWTYTLPYAAKVKAVQAQFAASSVVATRYPYFVAGTAPATSGNIVQVPLGAVTASEGFQYNAFEGAGNGPSGTGDSPQRVTVPWPSDLVLPAGYVVGVQTTNMQTTDAWTNIRITLEPA